MNSEPVPNDPSDDDEGPDYRALTDPAGLPAFCDRMLGSLPTDPDALEFVFEGVDVERVQDLWMAGLGVYEPEQDAPSTPAEIEAGASPTGPFGRIMADWDAETHRALRDAWGEPLVREAELVDGEPAGIIDYLLVAQDFSHIELWEKGDDFVGLLNDWAGEIGESAYRQILLVIPRAHIMNGIQALIGDEHTAQPLAMHGEHPLELRRRAWILSTLFDQGEVRLRDVSIEASRFSLRATSGTTLVWTFADDGRILVLMHAPESRMWKTLTAQTEPETADVTESGALPEELLIAVDRLLEGVPDDLRAAIQARAETASGAIAEHVLEFGVLAGRAVPLITGALWFDGETWRLPGGMVEAGYTLGVGMDDVGYPSALRRPFRLGGTLQPGHITRDEKLLTRAEEVFAACPYPEQDRPEAEERLGFGIPRDTNRGALVAEIERAAAAWWDVEPGDRGLGDLTFRVGDRDLTEQMDPDVLLGVLGRADVWAQDALRDWTGKLATVMSERWGAPQEYRVDDERTGFVQRTPITRVMRGAGLRAGWLWWVNGHAVVLLSGAPDPDLKTDAEVIVLVARADAVRELLPDLNLFDVRRRARIIANAAAIAGEGAENRTALDAPASTPWDGPVLEGSDIVPPATRGGVRVDTFFWVWHFTHDGRGLLTAHEFGPTAASGDFASLAALFDGVPDDLLSLVVDREPDGLYPVVRRDGEPQGDRLLERARVLPDAKAVFFDDEIYWRASTGMRRRARAESLAPTHDGTAADGDEADALTASPLPMLYGGEWGVPQLRWALYAGYGFAPESIAGENYGRLAFRRPLSLEEAQQAFGQLGTPLDAALIGSLDAVLDVIAERPGYRLLLDAALSNPDPQHRREIALWLLSREMDATGQLSALTPISVLLENPSLDVGDAVLLRRLLAKGADAGFGLLGPAGGRHPLLQLCDRDVDEEHILPLVDALLEHPYDLTAPLLPDGGNLLDHVRAGVGGHGRSRARIIALLLEHAEV